MKGCFRLRASHIPCVLSLFLLTACGGSGGGSVATPSYTVITSAGTGGTFDPLSTAVDHGDTASFTITTNLGYGIDEVSGCGDGGSLSGNTYTTGPITEDCTVSASFVDGVPFYTVSASAGNGGAISPASIQVNLNETTNFNVTPDPEYGIDEVTGCGGSLVDTTYTTGPITAACDVNASFIPALSIADASIAEGDTGTSDLIFTISLPEAANGEVTVDYATSDGTATAGSDYALNSGFVTIAGGATSTTLTIEVINDRRQEGDETFTVTLSNQSPTVALGENSSATGTITNEDENDVSLNDTGITFGGNYPTGNNADCLSGESIGEQDCSSGRDFTLNDDSDGHAGFSFTKLDANGGDLPASAAEWSCVRDNMTGLIWEVKQGSSGTIGDEGLHDADDKYNWYNTDPATNGGTVGHENDNGFVCTGYTLGSPETYCNTQAYVARVNASGLCGATNWRMPGKKELLGLVNYNSSGPGPTVDAVYFPRTKSASYWSSSPFASPSPEIAWAINFDTGISANSGSHNGFSIRLVRNEP